MESKGPRKIVDLAPKEFADSVQFPCNNLAPGSKRESQGENGGFGALGLKGFHKEAIQGTTPSHSWKLTIAGFWKTEAFLLGALRKGWDGAKSIPHIVDPKLARNAKKLESGQR